MLDHLLMKSSEAFCGPKMPIDGEQGQVVSLSRGSQEAICGVPMRQIDLEAPERDLSG